MDKPGIFVWVVTYTIIIQPNLAYLAFGFQPLNTYVKVKVDILFF